MGVTASLIGVDGWHGSQQQIRRNRFRMQALGSEKGNDCGEGDVDLMTHRDRNIGRSKRVDTLSSTSVEMQAWTSRRVATHLDVPPVHAHLGHVERLDRSFLGSKPCRQSGDRSVRGCDLVRSEDSSDKSFTKTQNGRFDRAGRDDIDANTHTAKRRRAIAAANRKHMGTFIHGPNLCASTTEEVRCFQFHRPRAGISSLSARLIRPIQRWRAGNDGTTHLATTHSYFS